MLFLSKLLSISIVLVIPQLIIKRGKCIIPTSFLVLSAEQVEVLEFRRKNAIRCDGGVKPTQFGDIVELYEPGNAVRQMTVYFIYGGFLLLHVAKESHVFVVFIGEDCRAVLLQRCQ